MRTILLPLCLLGLAFGQACLPAPARAEDPKPQGIPRATAREKKPFELLDGDRVVFVGGTFFDREGRLGYIETALTTRFPDRNITFRNLGYAGDTVRCEGRTVCEGWANFGPPDEGFEKLRKLVGEIKPTVVFVAYGMGESFEGGQKLPQFVKDYNKLLDMLSEASGGKPRFVLIGPNYHEEMDKPLPDPTEHNKQLRTYSEAIAKIAGERGAPFIDLFSITLHHYHLAPLPNDSKMPNAPHLTQDGIQLTPYGYWIVAQEVSHALGRPVWRWGVQVERSGKLDRSNGVKVEDVRPLGDGLEWRATSAVLPPPPNPSRENLGIAGPHFVTATGLAPGEYALNAGGKRLTQASAEGWEKSRLFANGPDADQAEKLRELIVAKNADYFNYWRHENDTYILGYRKHEQGKNAVELPQFIPLAEAKDKEINRLKVPRPVTYTLEKADKAGK